MKTSQGYLRLKWTGLSPLCCVVVCRKNDVDRNHNTNYSLLLEQLRTPGCQVTFISIAFHATQIDSKQLINRKIVIHWCKQLNSAAALKRKSSVIVQLKSVRWRLALLVAIGRQQSRKERKQKILAKCSYSSIMFHSQFITVCITKSICQQTQWKQTLSKVCTGSKCCNGQWYNNTLYIFRKDLETWDMNFKLCAQHINKYR